MRTDIHAPKTLDPSQYDLRGVFTVSTNAINNFIKELTAEGIRKAPHQDEDSCGHCGHQHLKYCAIVVHKDKREWILVGETCLSERFQGLTKAQFQVQRQISKRQRNFTDYISKHPELDRLREVASKGNSRAQSLVDAIQKYGALTDKQHAFALKLVDPNLKPDVLSDKQLAFIESLIKDRVVPEEVVEALGDLSQILKDNASGVINALQSFPYKVRVDAPVEEGLYYKNGIVFKVQTSQSSGRLYAKRLDGTSFRYDPFGIRGLTASDLLTLEQAKAYGIQFGVCAICGRTLTDETSVEQGIGPVCIKRYQ